MCECEKFSSRPDPRGAAWIVFQGCLMGFPGSATTQVDVCCEGNANPPQTRGNAAALVMHQLLISDYKSR